jgi:pSer/pThr/pTyr-binding forkhead associated (FHA) protein
VGWLVCVAGPDRGKDFRIKMEKNFIGRSPAMDICLSDAAVSREKHAAVVFDPKKRTFWLLPGDSQGLVYVNDELVHSPSTLKQHDKIELGETKLLFVPYPLEEFPWE